MAGASIGSLSIERCSTTSPCCTQPPPWWRNGRYFARNAARLGHPLQAKPNMGDAWIAATARAFRLPLLSADQVFRGVPNLELLPAAP